MIWKYEEPGRPGTFFKGHAHISIGRTDAAERFSRYVGCISHREKDQLDPGNS
jgi:hypothetical protein